MAVLGVAGGYVYYRLLREWIDTSRYIRSHEAGRLSLAEWKAESPSGS